MTQLAALVLLLRLAVETSRDLGHPRPVAGVGLPRGAKRKLLLVTAEAATSLAHLGRPRPVAQRKPAGPGFASSLRAARPRWVLAATTLENLQPKTQHGFAR